MSHAESIPKNYEKESKGSKVTVENDGSHHRKMEDRRLLDCWSYFSHTWDDPPIRFHFCVID